MGVIWSQVGSTRTSKYVKQGIVGLLPKQAFQGSLEVYYMRRCAINVEDCGEISFIPKVQQHTRMREEGNTNFYYVSVFTFRRSILLVCMWARHKM
jgi:hypothetical protein